MNRYEKYKDSGIAWIGEIPEHWEIIKMRFLSRFKTGDKDTVDREDDGEYPFYVRSPKIERINSYSFDGEAVLMAGDGVGAGKVLHYVNGKFDYHQRVYNFHNIKHIKPYLLYLYMQSFFSHKIDEGGAKNTVDSVRLPMIKDFSICIPNKQEQAKIAEYLDWKCGEVDKIVAVREEQIRLLGELRTSVISRAVTKGLNPDAPLKDSGIPWVGSIPAHWEVAALKYSLKGLQDGTHGTFNRVSSSYKLLSAKNVHSKGIVVSDNESSISEQDYNSIIANGYPQKGDILLCCVGTIGRCMIYEQSEPIAFQRSVSFLRVNNIAIPKYLLQLLRSSIFATQYSIHAKTSAQSGIYLGAINNMITLLPPLAEQQAIADYLDKKTAEIDSAVAKYKEQIAKLKEYRQALITEVVTGKIDVRDVVIPKKS